MAQKSKANRKHLRHRQPCYCIRCESGKFDDYLDKKNDPDKETKTNLRSLTRQP